MGLLDFLPTFVWRTPSGPLQPSAKTGKLAAEERFFDQRNVSEVYQTDASTVRSGTDKLWMAAGQLDSIARPMSLATEPFPGAKAQLDTFLNQYPQAKQFAETLKKGDVVCISGHTTVDTLSGSEWTHVAICVDPGDLKRGIPPTFVEAEGNETNALVNGQRVAGQSGVVKTTFVDMMERYLGDGGAKDPSNSFRIMRPTQDPAKIEAAVRYALGQIGKPYDYTFKQLGDDGGFYCSELAFKAYQVGAGVDMPLAQDPKRNGNIAAIRTLLIGLGADEKKTNAIIQQMGFQLGTQLSPAVLADPAKAKAVLNTLVKYLKRAIVDDLHKVDYFTKGGAVPTQLVDNMLTYGLAMLMSQVTGVPLKSLGIDGLRKAIDGVSEQNLTDSFYEGLDTVEGYVKKPDEPVYTEPPYYPPTYDPPAYDPPAVNMLTGSYPTVSVEWKTGWFGVPYLESHTEWHQFQYPNPVDVAAKAAYDTWYAARRAAYEVSYHSQKAYYDTVTFPATKAAKWLEFQGEHKAWEVSCAWTTAANKITFLGQLLDFKALFDKVQDVQKNPPASIPGMWSPGDVAEASDKVFEVTLSKDPNDPYTR